MTCIVGLVDKRSNKVIIGGDSASSSDSEMFLRKDVKVFKNGNFIFGCTSSFRMIQLLRFSFIPPEIKSKDIYQYMCTDFINEVRECFKVGGYLQKYATGDDKGGTFLVAYKNRLFNIQNDFQVGENLNGIDACGSGANFAIGSLFTVSKTDYNPNDKILKALECSEYFSLGVKRPFVLIST